MGEVDSALGEVQMSSRVDPRKQNGCGNKMVNCYYFTPSEERGGKHRLRSLILREGGKVKVYNTSC